MSTSAFAQCIEIDVSMQARQSLWDSIVLCKKIVLLHEKILSIPIMYHYENKFTKLVSFGIN